MDENERIWSYEFEKGKDITPGKMLLSEPFMFDENFKRTVVLVCSNDEENGTVGLILNKPINIRLQDVIDNFPPIKAKVFLGGPVGTDTIQFIHSLGDEIEGSRKLNDHLYWGGNFKQITDKIRNGEVKADDVTFYLGYSGWEPKQLQEEMEDNSWIVGKAQYKHIFRSDYLNLWRDVMTDMGGVYATMANYPESPILN